jgi:predicted double-glycine peptidase
MALGAFAAVVVVGCHRAEAQAGPRAPIRDPDRLFRKYVCSYQELARRQVVMQQRDFSCGAAALATVIRYYWGDPVTEDQFLKLMEQILTPEDIQERIRNGLALTDLRNLANKAGYQASIGRVEFNELTEAKVPVIVGIIVDEYDHFVVFRGAAGGWVYLADPSRGQIRIPVGTFRRQWQQQAILVVAKPGEKVKERNPMGIKPQEMYRGWLNDQFVRQNALTPKPPSPFLIP